MLSANLNNSAARFRLIFKAAVFGALIKCHPQHIIVIAHTKMTLDTEMYNAKTNTIKCGKHQQKLHWQCTVSLSCVRTPSPARVKVTHEQQLSLNPVRSERVYPVPHSLYKLWIYASSQRSVAKGHPVTSSIIQNGKTNSWQSDSNGKHAHKVPVVNSKWRSGHRSQRTQLEDTDCKNSTKGKFCIIETV